MQHIRIGTRGSPLALAQAEETRARLMAAHHLPHSAFEIVVIKTTGDKILNQALSELGGKGLFTKEIEEMLYDGRIDLAVHSCKDMPTQLPDELILDAFLPRADVRDAFISPKASSLHALPAGAVVGTASLRRQAMVKRLRPDLQVEVLRGNVQSRLKKLEAGIVDATLLAVAGLNRLGLNDVITDMIEISDFLPAVGQGVICIECRADHSEIRTLLAAIHDNETAACVTTERAFLAELDGSCQTPIAGLAQLYEDIISFEGLVLKPDGSQAHSIKQSGHYNEAKTIGITAGQILRSQIGDDFFNVHHENISDKNESGRL